MRIAVIAPGMMGAAVAQRLRARGAEVATTLRGRSPASAARAAGLALLPDEAALAGWADIVLSILPPGEALAVARLLAPALAARAGAVLFADCNAISPATMHQVAASLPGIRVADIGIIGGPPRDEGPGPRLYASGAEAAALLPLRDHGIDLRVIEGGIGAASALKMSYAGITKGLTALGSAMALGATQAGAAQALRAELAASQPDILRYLQRSVPDMFPKAYRWVAEMEEIAAFLGPSPAAPLYTAIARLYEDLAADQRAPSPDGPVARLASFTHKPPGETP
ncbi:MAG: NAD(P)-dependent oxidoreductase [Acetobacteraceae bacterium]|nr:NAD(P)-dependent oxidoreductase [Acetobacteraceae bacterium]